MRNVSAACDAQSCSSSLPQAAQLLVNLEPVVPQCLDAVAALLGVEVALSENGPRRLNTLLDLELRHHPDSPTGGDHLVTNAPAGLNARRATIRRQVLRAVS